MEYKSWAPCPSLSHKNLLCRLNFPFFFKLTGSKSPWWPGNPCVKEQQGWNQPGSLKDSTEHSNSKAEIGKNYFLWFKYMVAQMVKNLPAVWETRVQSLDQEDPLEKGMATHSSILAWRIPWTEEPIGPQSMGLKRVRHNWATNTFTYMLSTRHKSDSKTQTTSKNMGRDIPSKQWTKESWSGYTNSLKSDFTIKIITTDKKNFLLETKNDILRDHFIKKI